MFGSKHTIALYTRVIYVKTSFFKVIIIVTLWISNSTALSRFDLKV